ncbi:putative mitochondrial hypothetical protein [Leptomonas pyrrhocoris]|uniref:Uncharacterized protein n=1 Tax=Leptomonas pyrrhocoris TaxID=157538 RepID=A0A0N0E006_LEPPY|nr:putative mitochondrial hypothetical protein [Leptomonas pyrrhocoris]XP_015664328.1 putative mitochondrial hypothetical protein [Leptomonas pyrrhocoris]XP_015664329.1 putative mitochondrial hypothetical protein [Leptomonas pyrrhocoris]KPA85888.1 putative mitochondrial hypothetical protein [Leptomonas pyrrhocoris]KPA85889.1 putative mitochondrial hypothetical protein [Leptomonas pyrrhocoris]KPA85890.1 putative mitochondrial hypothetical protein [Leptomonas pyrrhocoris]|eukprot:XP_015664327.1 putative mitochondrial hypothetical protein [Leptomonas pyrrhocoris]
MSTCALTLLATGSAAIAYETWVVLRTRRGAVPVFNSAAVVRTEESVRYPCKHFCGFDAVVRSYYVPTTNKREKNARSDGDDAALTTTAASSHSSFPVRWRWFVSLFSNSTHKVSDDSTVPENEGEAASVRLVVRDAKASAMLPDRAAVNDTSVIAASLWPPHTSKYAALVLEPSASNDKDNGGPSPPPSRSPLRQLMDGATHQSLVRCNPRSTLLHMACEADPAYLGAPYLRVLLSGFLLLPPTLSQLNVAVLGVGGGSLPLFLQEYFASRLHRCDLVDAEPMCFTAAVEQLGLKESLNTVALRQEGGGVHYYVEDAVQYLRQRVHGRDTTARTTASGQRAVGFSASTVHASTPVFRAADCGIDGAGSSASSVVSPSTSSRRQHQLDLLFVDLFVGSELDGAVTSLDFLQLCRGALSPYGVAAFNLPAADKVFVQRCGVVFGDRNVLRIPVPASSNEVVLVRGGVGSRSDMVGAELSHRHLVRRAQELTAQYRLPYDLANHYPVWWRLW